MGATSEYSAKNDIPPGVHFKEVAPEKRPTLETGVPVFVGFGEATGQGGCGEVAAGRAKKIYRLTGWGQFEQCIRLKQHRKGKPVERQGRKATV